MAEPARSILGMPPSIYRPWLPVLFFLSVYIGAMSYYGAWRARPGGTSDFRDFWENANNFRATGQIAVDLGVHNYLPFFTMFMVPFALMPIQVAAGVFVLFSGALLTWLGATSELLWRGTLRSPPGLATYLGLALVLPYAHATMSLGQVGILLAFLVIAAWYLYEQGHEWEAGVALGLAILVKLLPAVLLLYFLLRGRWRLALSTVLVVFVLGAGLPTMSLGWDETLSQHSQFYERAIVGHSAKTTILSEKPIKAKYNNVSLPISLRRLLTPTDANPRENMPGLFVNVASVDRNIILVIYYAIVALLFGSSVVTTIWPHRSPPRSDFDATICERAEFGAWCCLMLLLSPLVWTHYLVLAAWPISVLAATIERNRSVQLPMSRASVAGLLVWAIGILSLASPTARAAGVPWLAVAVLWAANLRLASKSFQLRSGRIRT